MYSQLYRPKNLDELSFNNNLTKKLKNISLQNFIIYGNHGSGKMTRVYCHLAKIFNESVYQTRLHIHSLTKSIDVTYKASNYHIEISPGDYGSNDKTIICDFLGELASMANVITNDVKVFVIKNADKLSYKAQNALRNMLESTYKTARYIFTCTNINGVIEPLRSRFLLLRNPLPNRIDVNKILKNIGSKTGIKTSTRAINIIIENSIKLTGMINLSYIINIFQMSYINGKYVRYDINFTQYIDDLINLMQKKFTLSLVNEIRENIYTIYVSNIDMNIVLTYIMRYFMRFIHNDIYRYKIIEDAAKYQHFMVNGNKEPIYLEAYIMNIIDILQKKDVEKYNSKKIKIKKVTDKKNISQSIDDIKVI